MGALEPCASSTTRMIWAKAVSLPTRVARNRKVPCRLMVAPTTSPPGPFATGMLSPVIMDSSTVERPSSTTPSTGIRSPGRTTMMSPTCTWAMGTSTSTPPWTTRAVLGCRPMSFLMAADVRPLAWASRSLPRRMRVIRMALVSKYRPSKRAPLGLGLQELAQEDEGDQDGAGFKVQAVDAEAREEDRDKAVEVGGQRAQGHQHRHVGGAVLEVVVRIHVKLPAGVKLDRRRQGQLHPAVGEPVDEGIVDLEDVADHGQEQRQGERRRKAQQAPLADELRLAGRLLRVFVAFPGQERFVAQLLDAAD